MGGEPHLALPFPRGFPMMRARMHQGGCRLHRGGLLFPFLAMGNDWRWQRRTFTDCEGVWGNGVMANLSYLLH